MGLSFSCFISLDEMYSFFSSLTDLFSALLMILFVLLLLLLAVGELGDDVVELEWLLVVDFNSKSLFVAMLLADEELLLFRY